jgi:hypothetical protein
VKVVVTIDDERPEVVAALTRAHLEVVVLQNRLLMRKHGGRIPQLYESGILFRIEPWASTVQHFANCLEAIERGHADCKVLCCYRLAELREAAPTKEQAARYRLKLYWRIFNDEDPLHEGVGSKQSRKTMRIYHVQVRHPNGAIEDPSRLLHQ